MKKNIVSFMRRIVVDQRGQVLPWVVAGMTMIIGTAGMTIDLGHAYVVKAQLQNDANAAALAAAGQVYVSQSQSTAATNTGKAYSGSSGDQNVDNALGSVTTTVTTVCLNSQEPPGETCGSSSVANAVKVKESANVPTYLLQVLGISNIPVAAYATATMGGTAKPWNIAIIEDATGSMATADSNCGGITEFQCALEGIQTFLTQVNPCPTGMSTCTPAQASVRVSLWTFPNIITADLPIANACSGKTYTTPAPYQVMTLPKPGVTGYTPLTYSQTVSGTTTTWTASYEVTYGAGDADTNGFVSDYYAPSDSSTFGLNASSSIVQAIGYGGTASGSKTGCLPDSPSGIDPNGATNVGAKLPSITSTANGGTQATSTTKVNTLGVGEGITYYASAIYAAQSALIAEQNANPGSQNALILLSDGQANTQWIYFPQGSMAPTGTNVYTAPTTGTTCATAASSTTASTFKSELISGSTYTQGYSTLNSCPNYTALAAGNLTTPNSEANGTISGLYPDFFDECQQAITAGQAATTAGTTVFAVAYGAETTGCSSYTGAHADDYTDVTLVASGNNVTFSLSTLDPCKTMENIASSLTTFYSDYLQSGSGVDQSCVDANHDPTQISDIFSSIATTFTTPRLIPNNLT
jgi:Flp pilus assembly protein TadG